MRVLTHSHPPAHITPVLYQLHWLPLSSCIVFITFKAIHCLIHVYLSNHLHPYIPSWTCQSSSSRLLTILHTRVASVSVRSFRPIWPSNCGCSTTISLWLYFYTCKATSGFINELTNRQTNMALMTFMTHKAWITQKVKCHNILWNEMLWITDNKQAHLFTPTI